jgi:hypothetical protein
LDFFVHEAGWGEVVVEMEIEISKRCKKRESSECADS